MKKLIKVTALALVLGSFLSSAFAYESTEYQEDKQKSELQIQCEAKAQACLQRAEEIAENHYLACYYALVHKYDCDLQKEKILADLTEQCNQEFNECFPGAHPNVKVGD